MKKRRRKQKNRVYSQEFKLSAVERMLAGENVLALSRILEVHRSLLYYWLEQYRDKGLERLRGPGRPPFEEGFPTVATPAEVAAKRIAELEQKVGQQTLEVDFLKKAFKRVKESRQLNTSHGGAASTERSGQ